MFQFLDHPVCQPYSLYRFYRKPHLWGVYDCFSASTLRTIEVWSLCLALHGCSQWASVSWLRRAPPQSMFTFRTSIQTASGTDRKDVGPYITRPVFYDHKLCRTVTPPYAVLHAPSSPKGSTANNGQQSFRQPTRNVKKHYNARKVADKKPDLLDFIVVVTYIRIINVHLGNKIREF